ncbi:MAG: flagellar biosynthesis protein FlhB [Candidatus Neomarinimicrobiota bacterium]
MGDKPTQDKTEPATAKRRQEAREKGSVARSVELNSVAVLFAGLLGLQLIATGLSDNIIKMMVETYNLSSSINITPGSLPEQAGTLIKFVLAVLAPLLLTIMAVGLVVNYAQVGFVFSKKALEPKFDKINPLSGVKKLFSLRSLVELAKGILKIIIISFICYRIIARQADLYFTLSEYPVEVIIGILAQLIFKMTLYVGLALLVMALADFFYQRWEYEKSLRMTKQEVKDEYKQQENPDLKGHVRAAQRRIARSRMMVAVPDATVVVTNPTFIAIALKYQPVNPTDAPIVVAKGKRKLAQRIKEIAAANGVPIIENKPLARDLYDVCEIGLEIPIMYYQAIAEILATVFRKTKST